jgi:hypothetical protein
MQARSCRDMPAGEGRTAKQTLGTNGALCAALDRAWHTHHTARIPPKCPTKHGKAAWVSVPVELLNGALRVLAVHKVDEREAARLARVAVVRDVDPRDRPKRTEEVLRRARTCASAQRLGQHAQQDAGSKLHVDLFEQAVTPHTTAK